jgi:hypothetical protein
VTTRIALRWNFWVTAAIVAAFVGSFISVPTARAQSAASERRFHQSAEQVRKVVQDLHGSSSGHLPTLEGFVDDESAGGASLDKYQRGFYQCVVQVVPAAKGEVVVKVTAKITAWYAAADASKAGYKTLTSNGRLESDYLDRLEQVLGGGASADGSARAAGAASTSAPSASAATRSRSSAGVNSTASKSAKASPSKTNSTATSAPVAASPTSTANSTLDTAALKQRREAAERQTQELSANLRSLQEIQQNQAHPNDLASVKTDGSEIYAKPEVNSDVLMRAHQQDEFQVLSAEAQWVHVQISGASRGWMRRSQLEMPDGFEPTTKNVSTAGAAPPVTVEPFRVSREDTGTFPGAWKPLAGKMVRIVWISPTGSSSAAEKRAFAKSILIARAQSTTDAAGIAGVVVIFDSADGGQIAATLDDIRKLNDGAMREDAFWRDCSLDPPESFQQTSPNGMPE